MWPRDKTLGRVVPVKVLLPQFWDNAAALQRFVTEAQVAVQLERLIIVPVYGFESKKGSPAFAIRLLPGRSIADLLERAREDRPRGWFDESLSREARLDIFLSACAAVAYAHDRGVDRDLKPGNVVFSEHHDVYVVDRGIAKVLGMAEPRIMQSARQCRRCVHVACRQSE